MVELKWKLKEALTNIPDLPLHKGIVRLLETLGYESQRTVQVESIDNFLNMTNARDQLTENQLSLFENWNDLKFLFQITDSEIKASKQQKNSDIQFERGRNESFLFLAVELTHHNYSRTFLAETTRSVNRLFRMPVIVIFRNGQSLTLAAVHRRPNKVDSGKDVLERVTLVKDIDTTKPHRAHIEILSLLDLQTMVNEGVSSFDELHNKWEQILNVDTLNRRFYKELFSWFEWGVDNCKFPDDGAGEGSAERHVIRLITRLLFIWFLKEKGLVHDELFEEKFACAVLKNYTPECSDYYSAVLQNLFFATLNTEISKRRFTENTSGSEFELNEYHYRDLLTDPDQFVKNLSEIPFVNGGLFDCLDRISTSNVDDQLIDVFINDPIQRKILEVPARLFFDSQRGLFPLFRDYKFTVEENTPLEQDVALDPELLGLVFENLLAAYNPETRNSARQATGSYYTPRRVVDFMVKNSLTEVLVRKILPLVQNSDNWRSRISNLLDHSYPMNNVDKYFSEDEKRSVIASIASIKVLDPAVGSGAFPLGILQKLTLALRRLDPDNVLWEEFQKKLAKTAVEKAFDNHDSQQLSNSLHEISRLFDKYRQSDFGRKLYLIQNSIFGIDIQPTACQIAKLRLFISLVIEQDRDTNSDSPNHGIQPLPNLETRIVAANALLGLDQSTQAEIGQTDAVEKLEQQLTANRELHFHAMTIPEKLRLRKTDRQLRNKLAKELQLFGLPSTSAENVAKWNPYNQNSTANWFDPQYMFGISEGFDVVIGNPPYVESRNSLLSDKDKSAYIEQLSKDWGSELPRGSDLLIYFFGRGAWLLNTKGVGCFITQNSWLSTNYGLSFQTFTRGRFSFHRIIDTTSKFFSNADGPNINSIIASFEREENETIEYAIVDNEMNIADSKNVYVRQEQKWGHLFAMPQYFERLLFNMATNETSHKGYGIKFGQGINISKSDYNTQGASLPVIVDNAKFVAQKPDSAIDPSYLPDSRIGKVAALIMPRGIGTRHCCTFNSCRAFSYSAVELYLPDEHWESDLHYCLWAFLNSSLVWLFREITGRKNLGGGMLKAEATDMKSLPISFDFDFSCSAKDVFENLKLRDPRSVFEEIHTTEHIAIDDMVAQYFDCKKEMNQIRKALLKMVSDRTVRAQNRT